MFGWTLEATSIYMWLLSFGTAVESEMKATQDQQSLERCWQSYVPIARAVWIQTHERKLP